MNPSISVIIATYNRASLLPAAIKTVLDQTYRDVEVIVVDDGSADSTAEVCRSYGSAIRYVYQPNGGIAAARNLGFGVSRGKWIALLDDDDKWRGDKLALQVEQLRQVGEPAFVVCNGFRDEKLIRAIEDPSGFAGPRPELRLPPSSWIMSRTVFEAIGGFDESYRKIGEDISFIMKAYSQGIMIYYMNEPLVYWTSTPESLSSSASKRLACQERILNEFIDYIAKDHNYHIQYLYTLAKDASRLGDNERARRYYLKAFLLMPWNLKLGAKYLRAFLRKD